MTNPAVMVLGILLGLGTGVLINILFGATGSYLIDFVKGSDASGPPTWAWLLTLLGGMLGSFVAGLIGAGIGKEKIAWISSIIGGGLFLFPGVYIMVVTPAPLWFNIANLISYLLFSYLGAQVMIHSQSWPG